MSDYVMKTPWGQYAHLRVDDEIVEEKADEGILHLNTEDRLSFSSRLVDVFRLDISAEEYLKMIHFVLEEDNDVPLGYYRLYMDTAPGIFEEAPLDLFFDVVVRYLRAFDANYPKSYQLASANTA